MKMIKHPQIYLVIMVMAIFAVACNDKDYDLSKIDTSASVEADLGLPLGSTEFIALSKFLSIETVEGGLLTTNDDKDYVIKLEGPSIAPVSIEVPTLDMSFQIATNNTEIGVDFKAIFNSLSGMPGGIDFNTHIQGKSWADIRTQFSTFGFNLDDIDTGFDFDLKIDDGGDKIDPVFDIDVVDCEIPDIIVDMESVNVDSSIDVYFKLEGGQLSLKAGARIIFPDFMSIRLGENEDKLRLERPAGTPADADESKIDYHSVILKENLEFSSAHREHTFKLKIVKIDFTKLHDPSHPEQYDANHGITESGNKKYLNIHEKISIHGSVEGDMQNFDPVPAQTKITTRIDVGTMKLEQAMVKLDIAASFNGDEITVGSLPDFLTGPDVNLDIYNPVLKLAVSNGTSFEPEINADILAWNTTDTSGDPDVTIHIGSKAPTGAPDNKTAAITIPTGESVIYISRRGVQLTETNEKSIRVENLKELFNPLPAVIQVTNINAGLTSDEFKAFVFPETGGSYEISFGYSLDTPLAFGSGLSMKQSIPIEGIGGIFKDLTKDDGSMKLDLQDFELSFWLRNTLPLGVEINAVAKDADSQVIDGLNIKTEGKVEAGSVRRPSESAFKIIISGGEKLSQLETIDLEMNIKGTSIVGLEGTPLNAAYDETKDVPGQGVQLKNMKARLVAKVSADISDLVGGKKKDEGATEGNENEG